MSVTEAVLRSDPAGCYPAMDFESRDLYRHAVEELAKRTRRPEPSVAGAAIAVARHAVASKTTEPSADERERVSHVGYYLVDRRGRSALEKELDYRPALAQRIARFGRRHCAALYFGAMALATLATLAAVIAPLPGAASWGMRALAVLLALIPASEIGIAIVNQLTTIFVHPLACRASTT